MFSEDLPCFACSPSFHHVHPSTRKVYHKLMRLYLAMFFSNIKFQGSDCKQNLMYLSAGNNFRLLKNVAFIDMRTGLFIIIAVFLMGINLQTVTGK